METDIQPYTALKTIVAMSLDEEVKSMADFDRCWIFAFRALVLMHYQVLAEPVSVRLDVNANMTVNFPVGALQIHKVGILNDLGELSCLKINNALTTWKDSNPNRLSEISADLTDGIASGSVVPFWNFYYQGGCYNLYGTRGGVITHGDCTVDYTNRVIVLNPDFQYSQVMVQHMPTPQKDPDYQVPTSFTEAVIAFIRWKLKLGSRDEFYGAVVEARRTLPKKKVDLTKLNQLIRESTGMKLRS